MHVLGVDKKPRSRYILENRLGLRRYLVTWPVIMILWSKLTLNFVSVEVVSYVKIFFKCVQYMLPRKFYIRRNNIIANLLPWSDLEKCMYTTLFQLMMIKFYSHYLVYKYNFIYSLFWTTSKLTNDIKVI